MEFAADYFDGRTSRRRPVRVEVQGRVHIRGGDVDLAYERVQIEVKPRLGRTPARIALPDGGLLVARDFDAVEAALAVAPSRTLAHRLESHAPFVALALAGVLVAGWFAYREGVPRLARAIAERVSPELEAQASEETLRVLDAALLRPSRVAPARRFALETAFAQMRGHAGLPPAARLEFRDGGAIGPNALALPGHVIVVTDQLAEIMVDAEVEAVIAHEIGHLRHRHGMRQVLAHSVNGLILMGLFGDATALSGIAATVPTVLLTTSYSRDFEREADAYAIGLLGKSGRSAADFADALRTLADALEERRPQRRSRAGIEPRSSPDFGYLSTHPDIEERVREAEAAAQR